MLRLSFADVVDLKVILVVKSGTVASRTAYDSDSQPVCRGTQVCRQSGRSVPRPNVRNQKFTMKSFNEVFDCH